MGEPARPRQVGRWHDLGLRVLSASVLAPVVLLCIWFGAAAYVALVVAAGMVLAAEWVTLCGARPTTLPGSVVTGLLLLAGLAAAVQRPLSALFILAAGGALLFLATRRGTLAAGLLYLGVPLVALIWLRRDESVVGRMDVFFLVFVVWASDIGAYAAGRLLRGPKLAPGLSPGKTWSGAAGGLFAAMLVGAIGAGTLGTCVLAVVLGVVSQAGDLLESGIKRHFGVKDSGRLIPGHGGLLDRLDGLLAAAPVAALVVLGGRGGLL